MKKIFTHIKQLVGTHGNNEPLKGDDLKNLPSISNAFLVVEDGCIVDFGKMEDLQTSLSECSNVIDCTGRFILPTWCDSHTHLVFAATREDEFIDKLKGLSYAEIAAKGGGILNSARKLAAISEEELFALSAERLTQLIKMGTGAIEIKSGYGLSLDAEIKMLRVIQKLKNHFPIPIKSTFLGAHALPLEYRENRSGYIQLIIDEMLPIIAQEKLADFIDVFCEQSFFTIDEMQQVVQAGAEYGLPAKLHINQLNSFGALQKAIELNALSVDHLEIMTDDDVKDLANSKTIGTLLPSAAFFLRMNYQPARKLIDAGAVVALATDYNPGSSPSGNMNFLIALACIQMKMLPEEAINAATLNGAVAMQVQEEVGTIKKGKRANFILTKPINSLAYLPYSFGENCVEQVYILGERFEGK